MAFSFVNRVSIYLPVKNENRPSSLLESERCAATTGSFEGEATTWAAGDSPVDGAA